MTKEEKFEICSKCGCYIKELEHIYGERYGNCDINDYMDCDKVY